MESDLKTRARSDAVYNREQSNNNRNQNPQPPLANNAPNRQPPLVNQQPGPGIQPPGPGIQQPALVDQQLAPGNILPNQPLAQENNPPVPAHQQPGNQGNPLFELPTPFLPTAQDVKKGLQTPNVQFEDRLILPTELDPGKEVTVAWFQTGETLKIKRPCHVAQYIVFRAFNVGPTPNPNMQYNARYQGLLRERIGREVLVFVASEYVSDRYPFLSPRLKTKTTRLNANAARMEKPYCDVIKMDEDWQYGELGTISRFVVLHPKERKPYNIRFSDALLAKPVAISPLNLGIGGLAGATDSTPAKIGLGAAAAAMNWVSALSSQLISWWSENTGDLLTDFGA